MSFRSFSSLHLQWRILLLLLLDSAFQSLALNNDGVLLLSFKFVLKDPLVLLNWNVHDETPCFWTGVSCDGFSRVTGLALPSSGILGPVPPELGTIENLQRLDLSNNSLNGSLPKSLFEASELRFLDLSNNLIAGELPEVIAMNTNLQALNLSDNALAGKIPSNLGSLPSLTVVSLKNNYLSGVLPSGFHSVEVLDLSTNLINGSLRSDFGGDSLRYLNLSYNNLSGAIPPEFAKKIPGTATLDFSFNNLTGAIPKSEALLNQTTTSFSGNPDLCGEPTKKLCSTSSSLIPNISAPTSPPAIAAIPRTIDSDPANVTSGPPQKKQTGLKPVTIIGIVAGDIFGAAILAMIFLYIYRLKKKKKKIESTLKNDANTVKEPWSSPSSSSESRGFTRWSCLRKRTEDEESSSESTASDDEGGQERNSISGQKGQENQGNDQRKVGTLVTVDGEKELELETLLKASAYILGATGSSIMYKAVLEDGTTFAVRRIGESSVDRFKDFENQVRVVAKLVHPNLVRVRGFYWGVDEKLIIYDFVPNGCLANARYRKVGSSPCHLPWEARLKIAKGVARGLAYLHEKKHVHGNLKPSNILLGSDMEPKVGDFGLERLVTGDTSTKTWGSARNFGSKRSTASRDSFPEFIPGPSPSPSPSTFAISPYHAPESLRSLKPSPKWDVFSFGVILLELLTGKVVVLDESGQGPGIVVDDKTRALRMADVAIRAELEGKEECLLGCFKVGYNCASPVPQKRPTMKEVVQLLEKFPSSTSSSYYYYGN
ncbi:probable LRR receptor-like serine/threonine-protein kinase At4g37250 [Humulus lupulus]|uniref:probable LRR receptor-like serine/threonine-protein kinase At4g37250 n=1 Tax=Humulus lupulus TaxID=3486 RepID=UPI002B417F59|nr:probable LRR receptor-like serine/threonine-protein kinase At4g37250 [Humulus lupulus]